MIRDDEGLILQFNPFVNEQHKIALKLKSEFVKLSTDMLKEVPKKNTEKFVVEVQKILNNIEANTFYSIPEMVDFFHSIIKKNSVRTEITEGNLPLVSGS